MVAPLTSEQGTGTGSAPVHLQLDHSCSPKMLSIHLVELTAAAGYGSVVTASWRIRLSQSMVGLGIAMGISLFYQYMYTNHKVAVYIMLV